MFKFCDDPHANQRLNEWFAQGKVQEMVVVFETEPNTEEGAISTIGGASMAIKPRSLEDCQKGFQVVMETAARSLMMVAKQWADERGTGAGFKLPKEVIEKASQEFAIISVATIIDSVKENILSNSTEHILMQSRLNVVDPPKSDRAM